MRFQMILAARSAIEMPNLGKGLGVRLLVRLENARRGALRDLGTVLNRN
jgi:hypothetical protein